MTELLKGETEWVWGEAQTQTFNRDKSLLTTAPTLAFYDANRTTVVSADASSYGSGAAMLQEQENGLCPVAFCSRTLVVADTLSRHPLTHNGESDTEDDVKVFLQAALSTRPLSDDQLNAIKKPQTKIQISR